MKCAKCGKSFRYTGRTVYCKDCWKDYKNSLDKKFAEIFPEVVETTKKHYLKQAEEALKKLEVSDVKD